jgi:3-dehydroquinate synthase
MRELKKIKLDDYEIVFDEELSFLSEFLNHKKYSEIVILADSNTAECCYPKLIQKLPFLASAPLIVTPAGEANKNLSACEEIWAKMLQINADRKSVILNLGGGVIGDMGGFVAACYKRGIDFIQIPTTVLSQVDSSIGGKLGVDFRYGKNLIGVFKNPALVIMSTIWFDTLGQRQVVNGFAEIYKHALIQSPQQWEALSKDLTIPPITFYEILHDSLLVKKSVVEEDPFEKGWRKILNFGHTIGHAVEAYSLENDQEPLLHGEAIAAGMLMEGYIGTITSGFSTDNLQQLEKVFLAQYGHYFIPKGIEDALWNSMKLDKKNSGAKVMSVVLKSIGEPDIDVEITQDLLHKALFYYRTLS